MARKPRLVPFAITALVLVTLMVPIAYVTAPYAKRYLRLSQLDHPDDEVRRRAIAYAARHLTDPTHGAAAWRSMRRAMLEAAGDPVSEGEPRFEELRGAVEAVGQWRADRVPAGLWRVWLGRMLRSADPATRIEAVWLVADAPATSGDEASRRAHLEEASHDADAAVRLNAVAALAELSGEPGEVGESYGRSLAALADGQAPGPVKPPAWEAAGRLAIAIDRAAGAPAVDVATLLPEAPIGELLAGLSSEDAGLQALALTCLLAGAAPIDESERAELAGALLRSFDAVERRAGALLAGATGTHRALLEERLALSQDYADASMMRLGLWLQGGGEAGWDPALLLVTPEALPMPLVRWAMVVPALLADPASVAVERRRVAAATLDDLLRPRGDLPEGLIDELFAGHGWQALAPLTARVGAVPADAGAEVRELAAERLRDHWLVTRRRFLAADGAAASSR